MQNNLFTAFQTNWISLLVSLVIIGFLYFLARKRVGFGTRVLLALGLGLAAGIAFNTLKLDYKSVSTIGTIYVNLIKMLVMPLVVVLVIHSITSLSSLGQLRKIGVKTISWFLLTTGIAAAIGLAVALAVDPGAGIQQAVPKDFKAREIPTFSQVIIDLVPSNPINDMATGKVVPVLIFAIFVAVAIIHVGSKKPEAVQPVKQVVASLADILHQVVKYVIRLTPYGVYALVGSMAARYGLDTLAPLAKIIIASYIALILHFVFVFGGLVGLVAKVNPLKFFRKAYPTAAVAFTTRSSYATLPVNLEVITKRLRVSDRIASFVAPLGATMNFNGCGGVWPAVVAVFVAKVYNIPLGPSEYIVLILVAVISSIGVAGVPGPATISTTVVLTALGLPLEGMGLVIAVESVIDMGRTAVNATGTTVTSLLVANAEGEFDRESFNRGEEDPLETATA
ncbi:dicarboxylate/amino acid:cation symporter [Paenibacillus mucilaginosus]|uniref:Sodium:dicarboxylate symporter n=3 Tax=Paenibacillus mucilaginosus TaxID=61624 RepID=H6NGN7_9BACL|nr:dicarboxylate/amino acid:cation symporter [Paenibacillus mucilaginosus]AEI46339.1 sodium:dicarboxylate symporter [Paenibacillus mucilaginosus KNP414]AFC33940.1 sodium:dicarboxylate symporter [Paenibacillus mucilaginosus 3016]AFH66274.1 amino acid:proton symporter [Paenibacillus mucilaginosus K02]MCG7213547.1 dicarboxylate/amino acid:cation symporter [Paenibacillus mucilaginosus]WDM27637.1 dicarboxylate/amino acid:cation symporter [Paenibacillus mucilaginosus]